MKRVVPARQALGILAVCVLSAMRPAPAAQPAASLPPPATSIPDMAGQILTVTGPIDPSRLGPTIMHEHIFFSRRPPAGPDPVATDRELSQQPLSLRNLSVVRNYGFLSRLGQHYLGLTDMDDAVSEVSQFSRWGGSTIVDVTNIGLGRDPHALVQVAHATGLNIVMGAGYYAKQFHPPDMDQRTVEELTAIIIKDVTVGAEGTAIRSGIIGEVGVGGNPLTANEMKSLRAAARASRATGAAISFHVGGHMEEKFTVMDAVAAEGADLNRVVMGHSNWIVDDMPFMKRVLERGVYIQFDTLGYLEVISRSRLGRPDDAAAAQAVVELIQAGYLDRILLSQDVCTKLQLKKYGGRGFSYVMEFFLPELKRLGVTDAQIQTIMVENPRRVLTFAAPAPLSPPTASR